MSEEQELKVVESQAPVLTDADVSQIEVLARLARNAPRDEVACLDRVVQIATTSKEVAKECFYIVPRGKKDIEGPGIHLATLMASEWGNLWIKTHIVEEAPDYVMAQGWVADLQKNTWYSFDDIMPIRDKHGKRFSLDMIIMTKKAVQSKALRGAIFRMIGKIKSHEVNKRIMEFASGKDSGEPLQDRVAKMLSYFGKLKVSEDRVLWLLQIGDPVDITEDHLVQLIGLSTAIKDKEVSLEEAFPPTPQEKAKGKGEQLATDMLPDPMRTSDKDEVKK